MERIDLSHPLNPPFRPRSNPTLTPPARESTLPLITPSLTRDLREGVRGYPYSAAVETWGSGESPTKPGGEAAVLVCRPPEGVGRMEVDDVGTGGPSSPPQAGPSSSNADEQRSTAEESDDDDILDVSNTQWNAVITTKRARESERGSSRSGAAVPSSDTIAPSPAVSQLQKDRRRFEEEDAYWAEVERERKDPRREQLASLSAKRKRANASASTSRARSPASSPIPTRAARQSPNSTSPVPWSASPPRQSASSSTSIQPYSSPKPSARGDVTEVSLENLFDTPPRAVRRREPLRQIPLSDADSDEEEVDLARRSSDKGKAKAVPPVVSPPPQWEDAEDEIPQELAWMRAKAEAVAAAEEDDFGENDWEMDEAELALLDMPPPPAVGSTASSRRKKRRPTPFLIDDEPGDMDDHPPFPSSSKRKTPARALVNLSNLPLPRPSPVTAIPKGAPNVAGVHFSHLSASLGLANPMMFITDLPEVVQDFYRNHGKGVRKGENGGADDAFQKQRTGEGGNGRKGRLEVIEADTDEEGNGDRWGTDGGPQRPTGGGSGRGGGRGRGGGKWGGRGAWRGRGGFKSKGRGKAKAKSRKA